MAAALDCGRYVTPVVRTTSQANSIPWTATAAANAMAARLMVAKNARWYAAAIQNHMSARIPLTHRGEKVNEKTEKDDDRTYYMWERRFGTFQRTLPFPGGIDDKKIAAEFKDGVLTVRLPKTEEVKPKRQAIPIVTK